MAEKPLWRPSQQRIEEANVTRFARQAIRDWKLGLNDYPAFYRWSVEHPEQFWDSLWKFAGVRASAKGPRVLADGASMPGARWYPGARLNFAENLLRRRDATTALVFWGEDRVKRRVSHGELYDQVARVAGGLRALGVAPGDRVAAYLPNMPEAIAAMLGAASVGATFSTCSPDFGVRGVLDRFGQIAPKVLFIADGYFYNGKRIDTLDKAREIVAGLPGLKRVVIVPYVEPRPDASRIPGGQAFEDFVGSHAGGEIRFEQLPFDHPLYILFSSGTTGVPKCIVHGAGGALLKHLCEQLLHCDIKPGDRLFYFTTLGWMMWNWLASGLASGATLLLYDGSPFIEEGRILFDYADAEGVTHFGTSAKFLDAAAKAGVAPVKTHR
ncbi:MAG TPA: AMP-binding protein, partial [Burkholderiales bacterium]|nr:AMP-binding protein [Burkholderiales bacterium]